MFREVLGRVRFPTRKSRGEGRLANRMTAAGDMPEESAVPMKIPRCSLQGLLSQATVNRVKKFHRPCRVSINVAPGDGAERGAGAGQVHGLRRLRTLGHQESRSLGHGSEMDTVIDRNLLKIRRVSSWQQLRWAQNAPTTLTHVLLVGRHLVFLHGGLAGSLASVPVHGPA